MPTGLDPEIAGNVRDYIQESGFYTVKMGAGEWELTPTPPPPVLIKTSPVRILADGTVIGPLSDVIAERDKWPSQLFYEDQAKAAAAIELLETAEPTEDAIKLAEALRLARTAVGRATREQLNTFPRRVAMGLGRWFPQGQLVVWVKDLNYLKQQRPVHVLASMAVNDIDAVREALDHRGSMLNRAEDLFLVDQVPLYCDLAEGGTTGAGMSAQFAEFVFEYGGNVKIPPLDVVNTRDLHSVTLLKYIPKELFGTYEVIHTGSVQQDALREWFVLRYNELVAHLASFENFTTVAGEVAPLVQQQTGMTVARILQTTAHLLASSDQATRLSDFWALVDLYAGLRGNGAHENMFKARFWCRHAVQPALRLPGTLGQLFGEQAGHHYAGWVRQCIYGINQPSRRTATAVLVGNPPQPTPHQAFFARFVGIWRNTLHGYQPRDAQAFRDFLAIHEGSLPERLPEWGRYMLISLLEDPTALLHRFKHIPQVPDA